MALVLGLTSCGHQPASTLDRIPPSKLEAALQQAGSNKPELEAVLDHYDQLGDKTRVQAAQFLIANMPGHTSVDIGWVDKDGNALAFSPLEYPDYASALTALEGLKKQHGSVSRKKLQEILDIETIRRDYLINNIDLAVEVWREKPWAKELPFEVFCDYILPYRSSVEPLADWRRPMMLRYLDAADGITGPDLVKTVTDKMQKDVRRLVAFDSRYYMYPNSQGFERMMRSRHGRCEDITTMMTYALRANGFAGAYDFTPAWANRDNNHAWLVVLDREGRGKAPLANRAAKIFRRTYSLQEMVLEEGDAPESMPAWMQGRHFLDVTSQYMPVSDVRVPLESPPENAGPWAFLCVLNAGTWVPVQWSRVQDGQALFKDMGRNIAYLPAWFIDKKIQPAAAPLILDTDGNIQHLSGGSPLPDRINITATGQDVADADTQTTRPGMPIKQGSVYALFVWDKGWKLMWENRAESAALSLENMEENRLYWCREKDGRPLERIFIFKDNRQVVF